MENLTINRMNHQIESGINYNRNTECELPIIKYNFNGELISANRAGVELLCTIKGDSLDKTVEYMISKYPHLLEHYCETDFILNFNDTRYFFSAVSFDEAGYVGWYCYGTQNDFQSNTSHAA